MRPGDVILAVIGVICLSLGVAAVFDKKWGQEEPAARASLVALGFGGAAICMSVIALT